MARRRAATPLAVGLTATLDAPRAAVKLDLTGIPVGAASVTITRTSPSGNIAGVRGAVGAAVSGTTYTARDFEIPLGLSVTYNATVYDAGGAVVGSASVAFLVPYADCQAWLVDLARPTNSLQVVIESLAALDYPVPSGIYRVLDRRAPVVVALPAQTPAAELVVLTDSLDERDQCRYLFGSGYPFLVRTTQELGIGNAYFGLSEFVEERLLTLGTKPQRRFRVTVVQVERPDPAIYVPLAPNIYSNVKATYASYAALKAGVASYDALAYTYPVGVVNPLPPWPPDDV